MNYEIVEALTEKLLREEEILILKREKREYIRNHKENINRIENRMKKLKPIAIICKIPLSGILTLDKEYTVIKQTHNAYIIKCDNGIVTKISKERF